MPQVDIQVEANSLQPDRDALRQRVGLPETLSESDRGQVRDHMQGASQLDVAHFPHISFHSQAIVVQSDGSWLVKGALEIHGVTRQVTSKLRLFATATGPRVTGGFAISTSQFGIKPYEALGGLMKNKDGINLQMDLTLRPGNP
jgi:polyisoprenoid-binding protein YceI